MRRWTQEERQRQAVLIHGWKPWKRSTGPKSEDGKATASGNAMKHGMRSAEWAAEKKLLNEMMRDFQNAAKVVDV